jgi:hypothetical protein
MKPITQLILILLLTLMSTPVYAVDAERWEKAQEALFNESLPLAEGGVRGVIPSKQKYNFR